MLLVSWIPVVIFHFIPLKIVAVIVLGSLSILISLDVCSLVMTFIKKMTFGLTRINYEKRKNDRKLTTFWFISYVFFMFLMVNIITSLSELYITTLDTRFDIVAGVLLFITFLNKLLCSLQQVYIFFSFVRNPIYSKVCKKYGRMWLISVASTIVRLICKFIYCLFIQVLHPPPLAQPRLMSESI